MNSYGSPTYWDTRYAAEPSISFDWYLTYSELAPFLSPYVKADSTFEVLVAGCGNSTLSGALYDAGTRNISNVDISSVVISQLRHRYAAMAEMDFSVADATSMKRELPEDCFDLVRIN
jgi:ubiquinone/menaquinone biosynthesis C-methylase UbiE